MPHCQAGPEAVPVDARGGAGRAAGRALLRCRPGRRDLITFTVTGSFSFVPDDPSQPSYTGRFTVWGGGNDTAANDTATFTFSGTGKGSDGSKLAFSSVAHITAAEIDFSGDEPTIVSGTKVAF